MWTAALWLRFNLIPIRAPWCLPTVESGFVDPERQTMASVSPDPKAGQL
jgi:hypothetical protein